MLHAVRKIAGERQKNSELNQQLHVLEQTPQGGLMRVGVKGQVWGQFWNKRRDVHSRPRAELFVFGAAFARKRRTGFCRR